MSKLMSLMVIFLFVSCENELRMTKDEIALIQGGNETMPFRVLLVTQPEDSVILRKPCADLNLKKDEKLIRLLIQRMKATMVAEAGVGIAAPQIGISRNIFLFARIDKPGYPVEVAINPKIVSVPDKMICFERDGCLSIPDISGNSMRYPWIEVEYQNESGSIIRERLSGFSRDTDFTAIVFQHEYDHLQGVLFVDKLCDECREVTARK